MFSHEGTLLLFMSFLDCTYKDMFVPFKDQSKAGHDVPKEDMFLPDSLSDYPPYNNIDITFALPTVVILVFRLETVQTISFVLFQTCEGIRCRKLPSRTYSRLPWRSSQPWSFRKSPLFCSVKKYILGGSDYINLHGIKFLLRLRIFFP